MSARQQDASTAIDPADRVTLNESVSMTVREIVFEKDPLRAFGDMRRVQSPPGDLLWVCPVHYPEYDPGLPALP